MRVKFVCFAWVLTFLLSGCGKPRITSLGPDSTVLAFGDSLTSGYGVPAEESYPTVLSKQLGCQVINAGVSGEDTSAGLRRLPAELSAHHPDLVILCLGGNDMLRKQSSAHIKSNLRKMIEMIQNHGADLVLMGVPKPGLILRVPNFYEELAETYEIPCEGDVLKKVLSNRTLKSDQIHPKQKGYSLIAVSLFELIQNSEK